MTPYQTSGRCPERSSEPSCSSRERSASPSVRIDSSSCGSRPVLRSSSARQEPYTPSPEPHRTPATIESLRIGAESSLDKNIPRVQNPTTDRLGQAVFTCPRPSAKTLRPVFHAVPKSPTKGAENLTIKNIFVCGECCGEHRLLLAYLIDSSG